MKKKALVIVLLVVLVLVIGGAVFLNMQNNSLDKQIQGAWSLTSMDVGMGENARTRDDAEFMIYIVDNHYSAIRDLTEGDADRSFAADAGRYELDGDDFIVHHLLSSFPVLGSMTFTCSMEGDSTLILEPQYDKMVMPGFDFTPSEDGQMGYGDLAVRYVFERMD